MYKESSHLLIRSFILRPSLPLARLRFSSSHLRTMYETSRLRLRAHTPDDIPRLLSLYHDPETNRLMSNAYNFPMTRKTLEDVIFAVDAGNKLAVIIEHKESGAFMGSLTMTIQNSKNRDGVVGIALGKDWRSNGYGTEVLTWLLGFAFKELGLHRVSLQVFAINEAAYTVYEKM